MAFFQFALDNFVLVLVVLTLLLLVYLRLKLPSIVAERTGQLMIFMGALIIPIVVAMAGVSQSMHRATETSFCLSCHEMQPYGKSLFVDDDAAIQAVHFQNRSIPREAACFTCHTDYTMFGDYKVDADGFQLAHKMVMFQWQDGKKVIVWPEELANGKERYPTPPWNQR